MSKESVDMSSNSSCATWKAKMGSMMPGAQGLVFGPIGTLPLYALNVSIEAAGSPVRGFIEI
jgi:K+ transporter